MESLISIGLFLSFMVLGYVFGTLAEQRHYRSIRAREHQYRHVRVLNLRWPPSENVRQTVLVTGSVVVSVDYFKRFLAGLRILFGGRLNSYESLLDRARREAVLRLQQEAEFYQADRVYNLRFETSSISKGAGNSVGSIEVLAYGTALIAA